MKIWICKKCKREFKGKKPLEHGTIPITVFGRTEGESTVCDGEVFEVN